MWVAILGSLGVGPFASEAHARRFVAEQPDAAAWTIVFVSWPGKWRN